jgi:hypothetical protein
MAADAALDRSQDLLEPRPTPTATTARWRTLVRAFAVEPSPPQSSASAIRRLLARSRTTWTASWNALRGQTSYGMRAEKPYGNVSYADPGYQDDKQKRYPLDTERRVRSAWTYIHQEDNRKPYNAEQLKAIEGRIKAAGKKYGISYAEDDSGKG